MNPVEQFLRPLYEEKGCFVLIPVFLEMEFDKKKC